MPKGKSHLMNTTRRTLLRNALSFGSLAGVLGGTALVGATESVLAASPDASQTPGKDWHEELTKRMAALEARGGGTLELGDGVYEIGRPLCVPVSVSLIMTPNAVIRAKPKFDGDAVIIKGGGKQSKFSGTAGWIRGGVIDGGLQPITGIRVKELHRLEIADLVVLNCTYKGIHLLKGGYETNLTRVRCDVDTNAPYAPGSIGIHYERGDSKVLLAHVIGYEIGVRSDLGSNWFTAVHVWNFDPKQGPMKYCFYCNGGLNTFNQCYADSPTIAGFYVTQSHQSFMQCRVFYSRWAKDNAGVGFLITPKGKYGNYIGNVLFAAKGHTLAKAFDGDMEGATILATTGWDFHGGCENRLPSGDNVNRPPLNLAGAGIRLTPQPKPPTPDQGQVGEVRWVDDGDSSALWVKTSKGWKKSPLV
jgi:hypothetical protein